MAAGTIHGNTAGRSHHLRHHVIQVVGTRRPLEDLAFRL